MSVRATQLTYQGLTLLAKAQTGQELHFTRVVMGDGTVLDGQDLRQLTGLVNPKLELPIQDVKVSGVGTTVMETKLKNINLTAGFFAKEVGIFALDGATEILYAVRNTGSDSEYIPAGGGSEVWDLIYDVVTVVDQATNITANINGDIAYVPRLDFNAHVESATPHLNAPSLKAAVTTTDKFWAQSNSDNHLHPMTVDDAKKLILGGDGSDITNMRSQIDQIGREQANMALALEAQQIYPDYNALLAEDFTNPDLVDQFSCAITSIVAGDDSIDVETLRGIVPGAWYTISDGVYQETCQVKSAVKNGSTYRLIMQSAIVNTYVSGQTYLYRSTAEIQTSAGQAEGAGDRRTALWQPTITWTGANANTTVTIPMSTTAANASDFTIAGDAAFTADGFVTLQ